MFFATFRDEIGRFWLDPTSKIFKTRVKSSQFFFEIMLGLTESRIYEFGEFQLDAKSHRLFRRESGEIVQLTPKAVELLLVLVQNKGRVLTKDELLDTVWGNSFVEESNLSQTIFVLRKTLGDNTKEPRFIVTAPNRGYQFIASVTEINSEDKILDASFLPDIHQFEAERSETTNRGQRPNLLFFAVPIVLLLAFGVYWFYPTAKPATLREIRSIAVLPFEDLSVEPNEKYLGLSLADALVNKFTGLKQLTVRPTRTVAKYADSHDDASKIGSDLQVDAVLDGRIQRVGDRVRVSVQLVRTSDNVTIWTENFDDNFTNFLAIQDSISLKVVASLAFSLDDKEREKLNRNGTVNEEAYQEYLLGRFYWNKRTIESLQKAIGHFEQAIQKDPKYALAYTGLADSYQLLPEYNAATTEESFPKAKVAAQKALEIDGELAEAYTSLAYTQAFFEWDWPGAEQSFKRAIDLNPNYATTHQWYAEFLTDMGRFDEAHVQLDRATQIDPVSPIIASAVEASFYDQRKYDDAIAAGRKCIELDANFAYCYVSLGFAYEQKGMNAEAVDSIAKAMTLFGEPVEHATEVKVAFTNGGIRGFWKKRIELVETKPYLKSFPAQGKAFIYARIGDKEKALEWLNKSYQRRERFLTTARITPDFDSLRDDPRFQEMIRKMNFK